MRQLEDIGNIRGKGQVQKGRGTLHRRSLGSVLCSVGCRALLQKGPPGQADASVLILEAVMSQGQFRRTAMIRAEFAFLKDSSAGGTGEQVSKENHVGRWPGQGILQKCQPTMRN